MKKYNGKQRFLSLILTAALLFGTVAGVTMTAKAEEATGPIISKVADPATVNAWKNYFPMTNTGNAGGMWTDKSVFTDTAAYIAATDEQENAEAESGLAMLDSNNFLVALSAIASAKSIKGYSNIPTDTILVLDVSGSMSNSSSDDDMVNAANMAIDTLLKLNEHNRIGVVLYSSDSVTMLPLERYVAGDTYTSTTSTRNPNWYYGSGEDFYITTTTTYQEYLKFSNHTISVGDMLKTADGSNVIARSRSVTGGTYIQTGLEMAKDIFLNADTRIGENEIQAGTVRMPVTVLMSDGDPTYGTTRYYNVGNREFGDGSNSNDQLGFVTQLSAAYLKAKVEEYYGRSSLFYTLSLGIGTDSVAESVLNPTRSTAGIRGYWTDFLADGQVSWIEYGGRNTVTRTVQRPNNDTVALTGQKSYSTYRNYVTEYFSAGNATGLNDAFQSVVDAITLQSMYYPTLVEGTNFDASGYVEFRDYIGTGMEVKAVKGIQWGDTLFTGKQFAYTVKYHMGDITEPTEDGIALFNAVVDRMRVDESTAMDLIMAAYNAGQLAYNDTNPNHITYSNYIGWYAAQDGTFLQFWSGDDSFADAPTGAFQAVKSYFIMGGVGEGHRASDMLYASIQVRTTISDGEQIVYGRLPASLIPLIQYHITINSANPLEATQTTLDVVSNVPNRLLYEVGLSNNVNLYTLSAGTHEYYTNQWERELNEGEDPSTAHNTFASFQPSNENERYIYHEDMMVYVKNGENYVRYNGDAAPSGNNYYRAYLVYNATGNGNAAAVSIRYDRIPAQAMTADSLEARTDSTGNHWVVKKGTVHLYTPRAEVAKTENLTESLDHSEHPIVHLDPAYHVDAVLGNNGKLTIVITPPKMVYDDAGNEIDGQTVMVGDVLRYEITAMNYEKSAADIIITDTVPAGTVLVENSISNGGVYDANTGKLTWKFSAIASGKSVTVSFEVTVTEAALDSIDNAASIQVGNNPAYTTNTTHNPPVGKTSTSNNYTADGAVQVGDLLTYHIYYHNDTNATAQVIINDTIPAGTIYADGSASYSGTNALVLKRDADGVITGMTWTLNSVPAGSSGSVSFQVYVGPDAVSSVENTATIQVGDNAPVISTNTVEDELAYGDLMLTKTVEAGNASGSSDKYFTLVLYSGVEGVAALNGTFAVTGSSKVTSVTFINGHAMLEIKHGEQITIQDLPANITVSVYEQTVAGYTPSYSADAATTVANEVVSLNVVNTYNVNSTSTVLQANKILTGRDLQENEFSFLVYENGVVVSTGENAADGTIIFKPITYTAAGVHTYTVVEVKGGDDNIAYDTSEYTVTVTVTDDGSGNLMANVAYPRNGLTFRNAHTPDPVDVILQGTKVLTGRPLRDNEFSFLVYEGNTLVTTGGNNEDGTIVFKPITYAQAGIHTYRVVEVGSDAGGIGYDTTEFTVVVTVADDGNGNLVTSVAYPDGGIVFRNTYTTDAASVILEGSKILTGRTMKDNEFSFIVTENGKVVSTGLSKSNGSIVFTPITYTQTGVHVYEISEVKGNLGGVTYTNASYTATVTVTDDGNGNLVTSVSYSEPVVFTNHYIARGTSITPLGQKTLIGREMADNEFSFVITENGNVVATGLSKADGTIAFTAIHYASVGSHTYTVSEVKGNLGGVSYTAETFTFTVEVVDDGNGNLVATANYPAPVTFTNTYSTKSAEVVLSASKHLSGKNLTAGEFTFILTDAHGNVVQTITNAADGSIAFDALTFSSVGTYTYTVTEQVGSDSRYTYDKHVFTVTIQVYDNGQGELYTSVTYHNGTETVGAIKFYNNYIPDAIALDLNDQLTIRKDVNDLADAGFSPAGFLFEVYDWSGNLVTTGISDANGVIDLKDALVFKTAGEYRFRIVEKVTDVAGVIYDITEWIIHVRVAYDSATGLLSIAEVHSHKQDASGDTDEIVFNNTYDPEDVTLQFTVDKELTGRNLKAGEFTFQLIDANGTPIAQARNDADGNVIFTVAYDVMGVYSYTVREVQGNLGGITYDPNGYAAEVTVTDEGGKLTAKVTSEPVTFRNSYATRAATVTLQAGKELTGRPMEAGEFTFLLEGEGKTYTANNEADGTVTFEKLTFTAPGIYTYTIMEQAGDLAGVTYSDASYTATVTVVDDGIGHLIASVAYAQNGAEVTEPGFINAYQAEPVSVVLKATKALTGRALEEGEFTFTLTGTDGTTTAVNAADGSIVFDTLTFDQVGEYTYTLTENQGDKGGVTYDATEYTIKIVVADNYQTGKLEAVVLVNDTPVAADGNTYDLATFHNSYAAAAVTVKLDAAKELTGRTLNAGEFTFTLTDAEGNVTTVTNNADGIVDLGSFTFTAAGTYTYTLAETKGTLGGVTYDETEYTVSVYVVDNMLGQLEASVVVDSATVTASDDGSYDLATFQNRYAAASVDVTIEALKTLTGRTLADGEFSFALVGKDTSYDAVNDAEGKIAFQLTFTEVGTYIYTLNEVAGIKGGITYDETEYTVTVTVTDDLNGQLVAKASVENDAELKFQNAYAAERVQLTLGADKILAGRPLVDGEFSFLLTDENGKVITVNNDAEGNVEFDLTFTEAGVYTYTMREAIGNAEYIDYDETAYEVVVTVVDNGNGALVIESVTVNGEAAQTDALEIVFHNRYTEPEPPKTGDEFRAVLHMSVILVSVVALIVLVIGKKKQWFA